MNSYLMVFSSQLQRHYEYRVDFMMKIIKYVLAITLLAMVWAAVGRGSDNQLLSPQSLIVYYLGSALIFDLSNFHIWYVEEDIKLGNLSNLLVKPISSFWHYFSFQAAESTLDFVIKAVVLIPIIYFIIGSPIQFQNLGLVLLMVPIIYYFSFVFFFSMSSMAFWLTEVNAVRWGWMAVLRFISGVWIPLYLFSEQVQNFLLKLPFPHLVYSPIQMLLGEYSQSQILESFLLLIFWSVIMTLIMSLIWKRGLIAYESTGN